MRVMDSRLHIFTRGHGTYIYHGAALIDHIGKRNAVELRVRIQTTPTEKETQTAFANLRKRIGEPLKLEQYGDESQGQNEGPYDPRLSPRPYTYGSTSHTDGSENVYKVEAYYRYALNRTPLADEATKIGVLPITVHINDDTAVVRSELFDERLSP